MESLQLQAHPPPPPDSSLGRDARSELGGRQALGGRPTPGPSAGTAPALSRNEPLGERPSATLGCRGTTPHRKARRQPPLRPAPPGRAPRQRRLSPNYPHRRRCPSQPGKGQRPAGQSPHHAELLQRRHGPSDGSRAAGALSTRFGPTIPGGGSRIGPA